LADEYATRLLLFGQQLALQNDDDANNQPVTCLVSFSWTRATA